MYDARAGARGTRMYPRSLVFLVMYSRTGIHWYRSPKPIFVSFVYPRYVALAGSGRLAGTPRGGEEIHHAQA